MSIDLKIEELISLAEAVKRLPRRTNGKRINVATIHRWATTGCKGVRLETTYVGAHKYTSVEALGRFLDARNSAERPDRPGSRQQGQVTQSGTERTVRAVSAILGTEPVS